MFELFMINKVTSSIDEDYWWKSLDTEDLYNLVKGTKEVFMLLEIVFVNPLGQVKFTTKCPFPPWDELKPSNDNLK